MIIDLMGDFMVLMFIIIPIIFLVDALTTGGKEK